MVCHQGICVNSSWVCYSFENFLFSISSPFQDNALEAVQHAEKAVTEFGSMKTALQQLSDYMESVRLEAARRLVRLQTNSFSVPDEIISQILLLAGQCRQNHIFHHGNARREIFCAFRSAVALSHACRRFLLVSLHTPALWNRIADSMGPDIVETCLRRSGVMPLEIFLNPFARTSEMQAQCFKNLARTISTSSSRWSAFTLYSTNPMESKDAELDQLSSIEDAFGYLHAPQLTSLEIHIPGRISGTHLRLSTISKRFCHVWNVPQLHTMTASQFVPRPFSESTMLRCLDLKLGDRSRSGLAGGETLDIEALHRFLASCPMLADLRLSLSRLIEADSTYALNQPFALTCVETISLGFHSCSASFIDMVLGSITFPVASKLNLSIGLGVSHGHEVPQLVRVTFDRGKRFSVLKRLELGVECVDSALQIKNSGGLGRVQLPFCLLDDITHLTLCVDSFRVLPADGQRIPSLRSLLLKNCNTIGRGWLDGVLKKLEKQGDLENLEELRSESCKMIPNGECSLPLYSSRRAR